MTSYKDVMRFLDEVELNLNGEKLPMKGGGDSTEPYGTYETFLDNVFGYTKFVFGNNEQNKTDLSNSIDELDQCRKYKEEICNDESKGLEEHNESAITVNNPIGNNDLDYEDDMQPDMQPDRQHDRQDEIEDDTYKGVLLLKGKALV